MVGGEEEEEEEAKRMKGGNEEKNMDNQTLKINITSKRQR